MTLNRAKSHVRVIRKLGKPGALVLLPLALAALQRNTKNKWSSTAAFSTRLVLDLLTIYWYKRTNTDARGVWIFYLFGFFFCRHFLPAWVLDSLIIYWYKRTNTDASGAPGAFGSADEILAASGSKKKKPNLKEKRAVCVRILLEP